MKKFFLFFSLAFTWHFLSAQPYFFSKSSGTYTAITNPTVVSGSTPWSSFQSHTVPIGFTFNFFGNNFTTIFIEGSGFTRFDVNYYYLLNPYTVEMQDAGTGGPTSLSPLAYELTGTTPNRILKIQWENCEMANDPGSFANFQLWLYETAYTIEVHIGNCTINNPTAAFQGNANPGPVVGLFDYVQSIGYAVNGTPPSETMGSFSSITTVFDYSMSGVPTNGTIYTFYLGLGMDQTQADEIKIYPNPTTQQIRLKGIHAFPYKLKNALGEIVLEGVANEFIHIENLKPGIYFLEFSLNGNWYAKKLMKQ